MVDNPRAHTDKDNQTQGTLYKPSDQHIRANFGTVKDEKQTALDVQIGGGHYKDFAIQPIEFTMKNSLNFCQGNIIKYVCRYNHKNGIEDLKKAKHYIDLLIQLEYQDENKRESSVQENSHLYQKDD